MMWNATLGGLELDLEAETSDIARDDLIREFENQRDACLYASEHPRQMDGELIELSDDGDELQRIPVLVTASDCYDQEVK